MPLITGNILKESSILLVYKGVTGESAPLHAGIASLTQEQGIRKGDGQKDKEGTCVPQVPIGLRPGYGTEMATPKIIDRMKNGCKMAATLDLKAAYDTVPK